MKTRIALVLLGFLSILLSSLTKPKAPVHIKAVDLKPQEYMRQVKVRVFTETGFLKNFLSAETWSYLPQEAISLLVDPKLLLYRSDGSLWSLHAKKGKALQPSLGTLEQIILKESVVLERPATEKQFFIRLETQELRYLPKSQQIEGPYFVKITKPGLTITGVGLRASLEERSLKLLKDVKTQYTLPAPKGTP